MTGIKKEVRISCLVHIETFVQPTNQTTYRWAQSLMKSRGKNNNNNNNKETFDITLITITASAKKTTTTKTSTTTTTTKLPQPQQQQQQQNRNNICNNLNCVMSLSIMVLFPTETNSYLTVNLCFFITLNPVS